MFISSSSLGLLHRSRDSDGDNIAHDKKLSKWSRYQLLEQIGAGGFGKVFLCRDMLPESRWYRRTLAVKVVPLDALSDSEIALAMNEVAILRHMDNANVLRYIDNFIDNERQLCLVTEYVDGGDLASIMRHGESSTAAAYLVESYRITDVVRQCLQGLAYLHSNCIIHRDIKPSNIYLTTQGTVKIGDFGVSKLVGSTELVANTFIGTPFYLCPELCLGEPYSFGADIWALGAVTYELYCAKLPFAADNVLAQIHVVTEGKYDMEALHRPRTFTPTQLTALEKTYGSEFLQQEAALHRLVIELVERMLVADPLERPSAAQLLQEFFTGDPSLSPSLRSSMVLRPYSRAGTATPNVGGRPFSPYSPLPRPPSNTSAALLLANRVSLSYRALVDLLPLQQREDVLRASPVLPPSSNSLRLETPDIFVSVSTSVHSDALDRIPWLRHAEAFSSLCLHEGVDNDVVRVDWMDEEHLPIPSPHKRLLQRPQSSHEGGGLYAAARCIPQQQQQQKEQPRPASSKDMFLSEEVEPFVGSVKANRRSPSIGASLACHIRRLDSYDCLPIQRPLSKDGRTVRLPAPFLDGPPASEITVIPTTAIPMANGSASDSSSLGRCQGVPTEALEIMLRKKILASCAHRQRQLKAAREAQTAREEANARLQAELNELFMQSYSNLRRKADASSPLSHPPVSLGATQCPFGSPKTAFAKTMRAFETSVSRFPSLVAPADTSLTAAVMCMATKAAAVAARCEKLAANPPRRIDFSQHRTRRLEEDRASTSSVEEERRGENEEVYSVPMTLCIVRREAQVAATVVEAPAGDLAATGALPLPMSLALKPIRPYTRLDGIVWRVKSALKSHGLEHALLFPLDIDDPDEVGAEELQLRYLDRDGDVIVIAEASDWTYVVRDWFSRENVPWMKIFMVAT